MHIKIYLCINISFVGSFRPSLRGDLQTFLLLARLLVMFTHVLCWVTTGTDGIHRQLLGCPMSETLQ